jgi:hypothetical protein
MDMTIKGDKLIIEVDISAKAVKAGHESKSGKNIVLATTSGNVPVNGRSDIIVGLNVYTRKK